MNIKETAAKIYANNVNKGFWDKERNVGEMLMLVTSELSEALEADRKNRRANPEALQLLMDKGHTWEQSKAVFVDVFKDNVKDTFEDELADAVIRLLDIAEGMKIDLEWHIAQKMKYNETRERLHGKSY